MRNAIILHGQPDKEEYYNDNFPACSNSVWIPWIQKKLVKLDILAQTPELPRAYHPSYDDWRREFERFDINENTILVGWSCGGGFLIRWLSENTINVGNVVLVAPYLDPNKDDIPKFFDFKIDKKLIEKCKKLTIFHSLDDFEIIQQSVEILKNNIENIEIKYFEEYGHFAFNSPCKDEFPELLEEVLK